MIASTSGLSLKKMTRKYGAITSIVSGIVVEPMSSWRDTIDAAAANSDASRMKPNRKKIANHAIGAAESLQQRGLAGHGEPDDRDRGEDQDLPHREDRVADHLAGQERAHRDRRDQQLDDAGLLLFDDALRDRAAEQRRREQEHDAEADGDEVARGRRCPSSGFSSSTGGSCASCSSSCVGADDSAIDREARRRRRVADDRRVDVAALDEGLAPRRGRRLRDVEPVDALHVLLRVARSPRPGCRWLFAAWMPPQITSASAPRKRIDRRDHERLAAQLRADLALGDEPDRLAAAQAARTRCRAAAGAGVGGAHWMTSLKIWARDGCCGAKLATSPCATARRSTRCAVSSLSASNTA